MKSKAMVLSLATVGLLAVPICSLAQGAGKSGPVLTSNLTPGQPVQTLDPSDGSSVSLADHNTARMGGITLSNPGSKIIKGFGNGDDSGAGGGADPHVTPITPEPGAMALLVGSVAGGLVALRRRKK
ncbi:MAG: hypothetical protein JWN14_3706 [Chthonomonadales bacterium]|nr:hypothetical protein [Chthonomonadales bacterium]